MFFKYNQSMSNNVYIANCHGNILQKNVLKGGENNSQFMINYRQTKQRNYTHKPSFKRQMHAD